MMKEQNCHREKRKKKKSWSSLNIFQRHLLKIKKLLTLLKILVHLRKGIMWTGLLMRKQKKPATAEWKPLWNGYLKEKGETGNMRGGDLRPRFIKKNTQHSISNGRFK